MEKPRFGTIELTHRCNFNCLHCYNPLHGDPNKTELSTEEWIGLVGEMAAAGVEMVTLTGGEVFVRRDFDKIYSAFVHSGIKVCLETNASVLSDDVFNLLSEFPPIRFDISIYSFDQSQFQMFVGVKVSYKRVLDNIRRLRLIDSEIRVRCPITKHNFDIIPEIREFARSIDASWGVDEKVWWRQDGARLAHLRCQAKDVEALAATDDAYSELYRRLLLREEQPVHPKSCNWGTEAFYLNPFGEMYFCHVFWETTYPVRDGRFAEAWEVWHKKYRRRENDYCLAKHVCNSGGECPAGKFYFDTSEDMTRSLARRTKSYVDRQGSEFDPGKIGLTHQSLLDLIGDVN